MTAFDWDPRTYMKYGDQRTRPGRDLLARIDLADPKVVYDLGCGPGNSTALLRERWKRADITGIDSSADMIRQAEASDLNVTWQLADIAGWQPPKPADLIFSNATLHWLADHRKLFPALAAGIVPGGVLAVQMPRNFTAPSHTIIQQIAENGPWAATLRNLRDINPVDRPEDYYSYLAPYADNIDIWETEYIHTLSGENPVFDWVRSTALAPYLGAVDAALKEDFIRACCEKFAMVYRRRDDGITLFPFRRLFMVARIRQ